MKKNKNKKRLGVIAMTLLLILAVGATAGTTLAKYISSVTTSTQQATVAKWGYTITADATNMFGDIYDKDAKIQASRNGDSVVVKAESDTRQGGLVAPGTKGSMKFAINGTAEVDAILYLKFDADAFKNVVLTDGKETTPFEYYPIDWKVGGASVGGTSHAVNKYTLAQAILNKMTFSAGTVVAVNKNCEVYVYLPAGTSITMAEDLVIAWEWDFGAEGFDIGTNDNQDTLLGFIANGTEYNNLSENVKTWLAANHGVARPDPEDQSKYGEEGEESEQYKADLATYNAAPETFYNLLKEKSSTEIKLALSATIAQTKKTAAAFKTEYEAKEGFDVRVTA